LSDVTLERKVAALRSPATYPEPTLSVRSIETHFAWVFLTDDFAYKMKKPVRLAGMDLGSIDARARNCAEEVRLNRRLSADVYLDVMPLNVDSAGTLRLAGRGSVTEWLIKMRRLPESDMLDRCIATSTAEPAALRAVGTRLAKFYRSQPSIGFEPAQYGARLTMQIEADRQSLLDARLGLSRTEVHLLMDAQLEARTRLADEIEQRAADGRIVEAHGDLRPEHVCLSEPPRIIDCLEFSLDLRTLDPLEELAFFHIECERLGARWIGATVLEAYRNESGDAFTQALWHFYCSRRATVRAKIVAWHLLDEQQRDLAPWTARAEEYLAHALQYARAAARPGTITIPTA